MLNILSYLGMSLQSEVCLWTLLGLVRTIFDATLFKVNANLKQVPVSVMKESQYSYEVWQMSMPPELTLPVQRMLRTVISGVMLVQCFTVYVYLASYIVLLYPVFLEERPTLVIPWLLLAAIRKLLCELTSLALGLGTCVLLGASRPPCIRFVVLKVMSIMPAFYMWMLVYSYYDSLKVAAVYKPFPVSMSEDNDYGLELAIRRRRTKSLLGEEQLRQLVIPFYAENSLCSSNDMNRAKFNFRSRDNCEEKAMLGENIMKCEYENIVNHLSTTSHRNISDEDWFGSEVRIPRDTDRILEQFGVMALRISAFLNSNSAGAVPTFPIDSQSFVMPSKRDDIECTAMPSEDTETPISVGNSKVNTASYIQEYPQIFNKKHSEVRLHIRDDDKNNLSIIADDNISSYSKSSKHSKLSMASQSKTRQAKSKKLQDNAKLSEPIVENSEMSLSCDNKMDTNSLQSTLADNNGRLLSNNLSFKEDETNYKADHSSQTSIEVAPADMKPTTTGESSQDKKD